MQIAQRAARIEPFYVMEVAKAASALAREVAHALDDLGHALQEHQAKATIRPRASKISMCGEVCAKRRKQAQ